MNVLLIEPILNRYVVQADGQKFSSAGDDGTLLVFLDRTRIVLFMPNF